MARVMTSMTRPEPAPLAYFDPGDGRRIAYRLRAANPKVKGPALMFLPGYASDMEGTKASEIDVFAAAAGLAYLRIDYSGTGSSGGEFAESTLDRWLDEVVAAIDFLVEGPVVLIGSSMGGWLALHAALKRPDRVKGLVGVAAAPDFTDWGIKPDERESLLATARFERPGRDGGPPQVTHARFVGSGTELRLLHKPIMLQCPVRLIHGDKDEDVPIGVAFKLLEDAHSGDVQLTIIKWGDHQLSKPHEIETIVRTIAVLAEQLT
jgi:pimeloyl-ACP methyl ester carboxylesterase